MAKELGLDAVKREYLESLENRKRFLFEHCAKLTPIEGIVLITLFQLTEDFGTNNFSFLYQVKIDQYTVDFLLKYDSMDNDAISKQIIIECDGHDFHEKTKSQAAHDKKRDRHFTKRGYTVLRYTGSEIVNDRFKIWHDIQELLIPTHKQLGFGIGPEFEKEMEEWRKKGYGT